MKRFLVCLLETIGFILFILFMAASMFPYGLYCLCDHLFNK
jgi:hypothetical protein